MAVIMKSTIFRHVTPCSLVLRPSSELKSKPTKQAESRILLATPFFLVNFLSFIPEDGYSILF
jgi:hypothetical protein